MTSEEMEAVAAYIDAAVELGITKALAALPAPPEPTPVDLDALATEVLARAPVPVAGPQGVPGQDAVVDEDAIVAKVVARIPAPKDGAPAPPVDTMGIVRDILALIPTPRDGRDGIASRDELVALVNASVGERLAAAVEARVTEELAKRPDVRYRDVWKAENDYRTGNLVTFGGSLFHCNRDGTTAKPEDGSADWTLAVKRGRDGKDK